MMSLEKNPKMQAILRQVRALGGKPKEINRSSLAASPDCPILIINEGGVDPELLAQSFEGTPGVVVANGHATVIRVRGPALGGPRGAGQYKPREKEDWES